MQHLFVRFIGNFRTQCKRLQVKNNLRNVLFDSFHRGKFVFHASVKEFNSFHRRAGQSGKQNSSEAVADCKTETLLQRLADNFRIKVVVFKHFELRHIHFDHIIPP